MRCGLRRWTIEIFSSVGRATVTGSPRGIGYVSLGVVLFVPLTRTCLGGARATLIEYRFESGRFGPLRVRQEVWWYLYTVSHESP